jgi:hypothetical protein
VGAYMCVISMWVCAGISMWVCAAISSVSLGRIPFDFLQQDIPLIRRWMVQVRPTHAHTHTQVYAVYVIHIHTPSALALATVFYDLLLPWGRTYVAPSLPANTCMHSRIDPQE